MQRPLTPKQQRRALLAAPEEDPEFQIAPMIDVLLVLLVFFMSISSTEVLQKVEGITLPVAGDASDMEKGNQFAIVNIKWDMFGGGDDADGEGVVIIDENEYRNLADVTRLLSERVVNDPQLKVLVRADKDVEYRYLREAMIAISKAQIADIIFSVVNKADPGAGATAAAPAE